MQDSNQPALPSARSAFSRPRTRRTRPNIQPSPGLCKRLDFDGSASNDANSGNERDVARVLDEAAFEQQADFREKWRNNAAAKKRQTLAQVVTHENMPHSGWIPIPLSAEDTPTVLKRFHATQLNLERRPESPVPFLNRSSQVATSQSEVSSSSSTTPPPSSPPIGVFPSFFSNVEPHSSLRLLHRSLSDIPVQSYSAMCDEGSLDVPSSKSSGSIRGCLNSPRSHRSKENDNLPVSSHKSQQVKLTGIVIFQNRVK